MDPRTRRTRSRTLDAAFEVIGQCGLEATTVERIAERAGVHKTTVYRHWPERDDLLAEALETHMTPPPLPDSGSVHDDLLTAMLVFAHTISSPPWSTLLPNLFAAAAIDERLARLHHRFTFERRRTMIEVIERGQRRGQLPAELDSEHLVELLAGPILYRTFMTEATADAGYVERHVRATLAALAPC